MKTSKRKRSSKAASVAEASGVDVVTAETPDVAAVEAAVEAAAELSPVAVEALVAEPSVEPVADVSNEVAAEPALEETVVAEAVVIEVAAEPAVVGDPLVVLAANCSVKDAAALKTSLCAFSNHGDAVTLDVSAVERVDTATMQLLCAFVRDRGGRNQGVTWRGESPALQDAVRLLGVGALLGLETKGVAA
jgi:ABC-type transporter Mla MlaB component